MSTARTRLALAVSATAIAALALAGCASSDPLSGGDGATDEPSDSSTIVIGSQAYYSNEIIAEIYAQALEGAGFEVERNFNIGQRDAYMPSLEDGSIDLFPEYTGNLLQFFEPDTTATTSDDVYAALKDALPDGLTVLDQSSATDQDSYNVTAAFAAENNLVSIGDLAGIEGLVLGGAPELEERPYGPTGLKDVYDVTVGFEATGDTTVDELVAGNIQVANVYSADPLHQDQGSRDARGSEGPLPRLERGAGREHGHRRRDRRRHQRRERRAHPRGPRRPERAVDGRPEVVQGHRGRLALGERAELIRRVTIGPAAECRRPDVCA